MEPAAGDRYASPAMVVDTDESAFASTWLGSGWRSLVATALRGAAAMLTDLADWVDGGARPVPVPLRVVSRNGDGAYPLEGTRQRIADALGRARNRYEAVTSPSPTPRPRKGSRPPRRK